MRIALVYNARFPVKAYGGTERVVWWLAKGLHEAGHDVTLVADPKSQNPYGSVVPYEEKRIEGAIDNVDLYHYFAPPVIRPERPYVVTIGGNGRLGEHFLPNTIFVSEDHARRHRSTCFVHNGLDPDEYCYRRKKSDYAIFLGKASWNVKNVKGAVRIARTARVPLKVLGGKRWLFKRWRGVHWAGMVGGEEKAELIAGARALLFPVIWNEPFGIAVTEALVSGTPVVARRMGSLPELVVPEVGYLCDSMHEFVRALSEVDHFSSVTCREWVLENFTYTKMADKYLQYYAEVLNGRVLNPTPPHAVASPSVTFPIPE
ncbi:MAG: glycosyltransferase [Bdellovibrionales bacterium]|nr:glycosyltransferase [Bdellovibrionales bacterium]